MPLFGRSSPPANHTTTANNTPHQRHGLFGRSSSPTNHATTNASNQHHGGGLFHRNTDDPSIVAARERVLSAEAAERDADRALSQARVAVRQAREGVKRLEREAAEESVAAFPSTLVFFTSLTIVLT